MLRATLVLRNSEAKKHAAEVTAKAVGRADLGTPAATPTATSAPEETMTPWNGWFSSFLKDKMGPERYDKLRRLVLYRPDDYTGFEQMPRPNTKLHISEADPTLTHKYRQPSPGSQPPVALRATDPSFGNSGSDPYDASYFKRDTGRRYQSDDPLDRDRDLERIKLELLPQDDPRVQEAKEEFEKGPGSSPGNKSVFAMGPSPTNLDSTRASMSANWADTQKSLDDNMPDHLPTPVWWDEQDEIVKWYEERDLPVPIGGTGFGLVPTHARVARW